jgi:H+-translocating NAD(P) transhydrogenase subunit beta
MVALIVETLLGFLTFTASLMAFGKLQEVLPRAPITYKGPELRQSDVLRHGAALGIG